MRGPPTEPADGKEPEAPAPSGERASEAARGTIANPDEVDSLATIDRSLSALMAQADSLAQEISQEWLRPHPYGEAADHVVPVGLKEELFRPDAAGPLCAERRWRRLAREAAVLNERIDETRRRAREISEQFFQLRANGLDVRQRQRALMQRMWLLAEYRDSLALNSLHLAEWSEEVRALRQVERSRWISKDKRAG